jgi:hypothetical protein
VDEIKIDVVELEARQALVEGTQRLVIAVTVVPNLRGDEEFVT